MSEEQSAPVLVEHENIPYEVSLGKVVGFYGLKGYLKVQTSFPRPQILLDIESALVVQKGKPPEILAIEDLKLEGRSFLLLLADYQSRTEAETLLGAELFVSKSMLPELSDDEWWISELIGLPVYSTNGEHLGTVSDVLGAGNDFLEIKKLGEEDKEPKLIPFVKQLVPKVDIKARRIEIDAIPGLLD